MTCFLQRRPSIGAAGMAPGLRHAESVAANTTAATLAAGAWPVSSETPNRIQKSFQLGFDCATRSRFVANITAAYRHLAGTAVQR